MTLLVKKFSILNKRHYSKVFFLTLTIFFIGFYFMSVSIGNKNYLIKFSLQWKFYELIEATKQHKMILLWNSPHKIEAAAFGTGHQAFIDAQCPVSNCEIVGNSSELWSEMEKSDFNLLAKFDAVLFNVHEMPSSPLPPPHYQRPERQRFVLFTQESPQAIDKLERYNEFFNWTMSFQRDSDILLLYGRIHPNVEREPNPKSHVHQPNHNKTKKVAWMVSHCGTYGRREVYAKEFTKHIQVDIYGGCGNLSCPRNATHWLSYPECYDKLSSEYKFYLSFENAICKDYVTEKFFNILQHDMVPVVYGGADYKSIAPPHSFINSADFKTPADLAAYLLLLDGNDNLYESYFDWKSQFSVEAGVEQMARHAFCDLCAKLNQPEEPLKVYKSLIPQWSVADQCNKLRLIN